MAVHAHPNHTSHHFLASLRAAARPAAAVRAGAAAATMAGARLLLGSVFLWAFLDKTFGWGYATRSSAAWINGGSPTRGFLAHVSAGPLQSTFHGWAGQGWADWLFMLGLLGIGTALLTGIALRPAAVSGTLLLALMWAAEWPPARHLSTGAASGSTNPFTDYHVIYAVLLVALAAANAGRTWGLGRQWAALPVVRDHAWLR